MQKTAVSWSLYGWSCTLCLHTLYTVKILKIPPGTLLTDYITVLLNSSLRKYLSPLNLPVSERTHISPSPCWVITTWTKGGFRGNHINQSVSATASITLGHFLHTGSSPHMFMGLSAGSHKVKIVPNGCGRNRRPVSTSFVVWSYSSGL